MYCLTSGIWSRRIFRTNTVFSFIIVPIRSNWTSTPIDMNPWGFQRVFASIDRNIPISISIIKLVVFNTVWKRIPLSFHKPIIFSSSKNLKRDTHIGSKIRNFSHNKSFIIMFTCLPIKGSRQWLVIILKIYSWMKISSSVLIPLKLNTIACILGIRLCIIASWISIFSTVPLGLNIRCVRISKFHPTGCRSCFLRF